MFKRSDNLNVFGIFLQKNFSEEKSSKTSVLTLIILSFLCLYKNELIVQRINYVTVH